MSDALPPNLPPPLPADEVFLGRAIVNRRFRFLSVSQVVKFDARQEGGCPRAWSYEKIFQKKEVIDDDDPRSRGKVFAREVELYLKYNYDALSPTMRAGKHLLPKPGPDLEVEEPLAGSPERTKAAIELRDRMLAGAAVTEDDMERASLLSLSGIPFVGAADYCHQRGYYLTDGGVLVKEPHVDTAECGDHKTTVRIRDHQTTPRKKGAKPIVLPGYAKTPEQIGRHPQMLGYGVRTWNKHRHVKWVRLSHNYYQRKSYSADKRTILLPVETIIERWRSEVAPVVREMVDVAASITKPEEAPFNLRSCKAFGRECVHAEYCDRPLRDIVDMAADWFGGGGTGSMNFTDLFPGAGSANGVVAPESDMTASLFPGAPAAAPSAPPPPMTDEERTAAIAAERAKLLTAPPPSRHPLEGIEGFTVGQECNGTGFYRNQTGSGGFIAVEVGHKCARCAQPPRLPEMAAVNPVDQPHVDHIAAADALTPEAIAEITDPELRAKVEAHARAVEERRAAEEEARRAAAVAQGKKPSGCSGIAQRLGMDQKMMLTRKARCPGCGKELKIKDKDIDMSVEPFAFVVPKHKLADEASVAAPVVAPVAVAPPALPPSTPPALPVAVSSESATTAPSNLPPPLPASVGSPTPTAALAPSLLPPLAALSPSTPVANSSSVGAQVFAVETVNNAHYNVIAANLVEALQKLGDIKVVSIALVPGKVIL